MFPDRESYRDSKSYLELMRSSGNDFVNFDFRDSSKQFHDNIFENTNFFHNPILMEESLTSFSQEKKKKKSFKDILNNDVVFEVREAQAEVDVKSTIKELAEILRNEDYESAIEFLELRVPLLLNSNVIIRLALKKLNLFKNVCSNKMNAVYNDLNYINETLKSCNCTNWLRKLEILSGLIEFPEVIKSRYYSSKKIDLLNSVHDFVSGSLTISDYLFISDVNPNNPYKMMELNCILADFEDELVFYQACFFKIKHIYCNFDDFIEGYQSSLIFDKCNAISNSIIIDDFLQSSSQQRLKLTAVQEPSIINQKIITTNEEKSDIGPFHILKVLPTSNTCLQSSQVDENETVYSNELTSQSLETDGNAIQMDCKTKQKNTKNVKLNTIKPFAFKHLKKENIDKKILRKFRKYVALRLKQIDLKFVSRFVVDFSSSLMFPPFTYENKTFKSFNSSYLLWLFSNFELADFYEEYIDLSLGKLIEFLINTFKIVDKCEIENLEKYLKVMAHIYSNSIVKGHTIVPQLDINEVAKRNTSTSLGLESDFMRLSVDTQKLPENTQVKNGCLEDKKNSILSNNSNFAISQHKKSSLRMSVQQREELITKLFDECTLDMD